MKLIGLTGGIGSGKTIVADIFRTLGIPVYVSDERAKILMHADETVKNQIITLFGPKAYHEDGQLNNSWIASQVFNDRNVLLQLNAIVHPAVFLDLQQWASQASQVAAPYLIQESAILFEADLTKRFDAIVLVVAPEAIRIQRVMQRDGASKEAAMARMNNQWPDAEKIVRADFVIYNDGLRALIPQVTDIDQMIRSFGQSPK